MSCSIEKCNNRMVRERLKIRRLCAARNVIYFIFLFISCTVFGQQELKLQIINDTIKKVSSYDDCNIFYSITNTSNTDYYFIIDPSEFNETPDYNVEPLFVGLPDYFLYEKDNLLQPNFSFGASGINKINLPGHCDGIDDSHGRRRTSRVINCRISGLLMHLRPGEQKVFRTKVNFPNYKTRSYNLTNNNNYFFQIGVNIPIHFHNMINKLIPKSDRDYKVFSGKLVSDKIPLIFQVYN